VVSALLRSHVEQRGPVTETVEPRLSASPAWHPGLELGTGEGRALLMPSSSLVSHAAGILFGLLGASAGALQRPGIVLGSHPSHPSARSRWLPRCDRPTKDDLPGPGHWQTLAGFLACR
jgi:hypothetical protein